MKKKELKEIQTMTLKELRALEKKMITELVRLKVDLKAGKMKNFCQFWAKKRNFARIKTIIKEKELHETV